MGAAVGVFYLTRDVITVPTVVFIGSFLVPVTAVVWYLDHNPSPELSPLRIIMAFIIAGTIGLLAAALLESYLVGTGSLSNLEVGLIEESIKAALIVVVALGIRSFHTRDGMVLGAAVGFGFAALESSGYAVASILAVRGHHHFLLSLDSVVLTELARGVLAPFGHGMWSAIVGGAIFATALDSRLRVVWVLGTLALVIGLHAASDSIPTIPGYVVVSTIGAIPLVYLWLRADGRRSLLLQTIPQPAVAR